MTSFLEHLTVSSPDSVSIPDIHNDLQRELAFYQQALKSAIFARSEIISLGKPFTKPDTFFAETLKTSEHMQKIKQKQDEEELALKKSADAKKQRAYKKLGKKIQAEKELEKQERKNKELKKIDLLKKQRKSMATENEEFDDFDIEVEDAVENAPNQRKPRSRINKKRESKNAKYGNGGRKKNMKRNTSESTNDVSGFKPSKKTSSKKNRPGKSRRQNSRK